VRAGIPGGDKKFTRVIQQPNCPFVRAGLSEPVFDRLAHQRIEHRRELLRMNAFGNSLESFR
jgi:hypothetical protein